MPKLLVNDLKNKKHPLPPCGRRRKSVQPHSRFQRMIDDRMLGEKMSYRDLALAMGKGGGKVNQSTLWVWTHSETGYPAPRSLTPQRLHALADALQLQEADIRKALDESRAIYSGKPELTPRSSLDALATLQSILERSRTTHVKRTWVLHYVKKLRSGAQTLPVPKR